MDYDHINSGLSYIAGDRGTEAAEGIWILMVQVKSRAHPLGSYTGLLLNHFFVKDLLIQCHVEFPQF